MNTYYSGRSSRPAGLFSFGLLDGPPWTTVSRTSRLTNSPARTDVARFYSAPRAPCEKPTEGVRLGAWGGRVKSRLRSQPLRDGIHEQSEL
ncbi:MAG: hypothetical protein M3Z35_12235, partial [Nitrospirota bacterium]|nr:hypothetical protein [Nitrospirota bacterium]